MDQLIGYIQENIQYAPYIIFGLLLLAGLNIPVSEDLMLFISGTLAATYPDFLVLLFLGVFWGAYLSDLICYWLGRYLGQTIFSREGFLTKFVSAKKMTQVQQFYESYGIITLVLGRFIPFGVRNALFLTAGIGRMNFVKFALSDLLACSISCSVYFYLYYKIGRPMITYVKKGNIVIFSLAALVVLALLFFKRKKMLSASK